MPITLTLPLCYTSFYNESKEKEFLSENEIDVYIKYNKVSLSIINHEKENIFYPIENKTSNTTEFFKSVLKL